MSHTKEDSTPNHDILVATKNRIRTIKFNRPKRKNALNPEMFEAITTALWESNEDEDVSIVVLTGAGDYFSSGNDLGNFLNGSTQDPTEMAKTATDLLRRHFAAYIELKKILIAIVNGPAVGVGATILGLCDAVFATEKATFRTPFTSLGQSPEACSSYIFPRVMGFAKASELLFFNQTITAKEALECGLVTKLFPHDKLETEAWKRVHEMAELPVKSLIYTKELVRGRSRAILHEVNNAECDRLEERCISEDCANAVMKFFLDRSKL